MWNGRSTLNFSSLPSAVLSFHSSNVLWKRRPQQQQLTSPQSAFAPKLRIFRSLLWETTCWFGTIHCQTAISHYKSSSFWKWQDRSRFECWTLNVQLLLLPCLFSLPMNYSSENYLRCCLLWLCHWSDFQMFAWMIIKMVMRALHFQPLLQIINPPPTLFRNNSSMWFGHFP